MEREKKRLDLTHGDDESKRETESESESETTHQKKEFFSYGFWSRQQWFLRADNESEITISQAFFFLQSKIISK